jgi:hypothetical protein
MERHIVTTATVIQADRGDATKRLSAVTGPILAVTRDRAPQTVTLLQ